MHWRLAFITISLLLGTVVALNLAYLGWTRRRSVGATAFILMMLAISIWSLAYSLEQFTPLLQEKIFWHKVAYLGIPFVPFFWFIFNAQILSYRFASERRWLAVLSIIPIATTALTWTMEQHGFMWGTLYTADYHGISYLALERLPDFFFFVGYSYVLLLIGSALFLKVLFRSASLRIPAIISMTIAIAMPVVFNVMRIIFDVDPFFPYDLTPLALTTTGITAGWFVFRFGPLDILSVAHVRVLENIDDGFIVLNTSGVIVNVNDTVCKMLCVPKDDSIGQSLISLIPQDCTYLNAETGEPFEEELTALMLDPPPSRESQPIHREVIVRELAGIEEDICLDVSLSYLYDQRRRFKGSLLFIRDISQRKRTQQVLMQAQRMESTGLLAGGVAHDFNNLLAAITMRHQLAVNALRGKPVDGHEQFEPSGLMAMTNAAPSKLDSQALRHIEVAGKAVERATDLTRQLLAYTGKGHFKIEPLNINRLIEENRALLATAVPKEINLQIDVSPVPLHVKADRGQLQQVVMNLILNAVEAIGDACGQIKVQTGICHIGAEEASEFIWKDISQPGTYIYLKVSDTGSGMSADVQNRIFDPFYTTKVNGRGLGLAALLGAIHLYKGGIQVVSKEGQGTTFRALLPATEEPADSHEPFRQPRYAADGRPRGTILLADDEESVLEVLCEILEDAGLEVITASNGRKAVESFRMHQHRIDLLLLDTKMPVMGGVEALATIRQLSPDISALLSSGYSEEQVSSAVQWDANTDFIQKPYEIDDLLIKLDNLLKRRQNHLLAASRSFASESTLR